MVEIIGGVYTNSIAILSDALHDLGDSLSLGLSWYFENLSKRSRDQHFTYGYGRFSLLAAFINGAVLIVGSIWIFSEAIPRLWEPEQPYAEGMVILAIAGILFNGIAVLKLKSGKSMNLKVASWHLLEDVLGWIAVLIISLIMIFWHVPILDPIFSLLFTGFILFNVLKNFGQTIKIFLQAKPKDIDLKNFEKKLNGVSDVKSIHDVHAWSMDGQYYVMTVHLVVADDISVERIKEIKQEARDISSNFSIDHVTIEVEYISEPCALENC